MSPIYPIGQLAVSYEKLSGLVGYPRNPRNHSSNQIKQIARSIEAFGFVVPLLVDCQNRIVAGHGRFEAAQLLGLSEVPVIRLEHLTDSQANAFRIADNRITELSKWNDKLLAETLRELSQIDLNFNLEAIGFSLAEIDLKIVGLSTNTDGHDPADQIPESAETAPASEVGDLWRLGRHTIMCASALSPEAYRRLFGSDRAHMVFADPPYNVKIGGHASGLGRIQHREFAMAAGELDAAEFASFLTRSCTLAATHSVDGAIHFVCIDWRHIGELLEAGRLAYDELKNICVWAKDNGGMGSLYRSRHELVFVFKHGTAPHRNNVQLGKYGRNRTNVWQYPCANTFSRQSDEGRLADLHPTVKPVAMVADAIMDCSVRGDIVLDPFLGSGTTLIAAERVGRICKGIELDPRYIDTIIRRWQAYTGNMAIHTNTGMRFDDVAAMTEARHD